MADLRRPGEFRHEFANLLGTIEERPTIHTGDRLGALKPDVIEGTDELFKKLSEHPDVPVDARQFLLARLTDVFLGDWDRHADQWRWARVSGPGRGALASDSAGPGPGVRPLRWSHAELRATQCTSAAGVRNRLRANRRRDLERAEPGPAVPGRPGTAGLGFRGQGSEGESTDNAIATAVKSLPPEYQRLDGPRLERALRKRRDHIEKMADKYYRLLAAPTPPGSSPSAASSAATAGCSPSISSRPMTAATSTSSRPHFGAPIGEPSI